MWYRFAADLVLVLHAAFIVFVVLGGVLVWRRPRLAWVHLACVAWGVVVVATGAICPLTPLENDLRLKAGQAGLTGGFIEHYIVNLIYPPGLTRPIQMGLAVLLLLVNVGLYVAAWRRSRR